MTPRTPQLPLVATLVAISMIAMEGLQYTSGGTDLRQIFLISDGEKLRAHLEAHLQRIVAACDVDDGKWVVLDARDASAGTECGRDRAGVGRRAARRTSGALSRSPR